MAACIMSHSAIKPPANAFAKPTSKAEDVTSARPDTFTLTKATISDALLVFATATPQSVVWLAAMSKVMSRVTFQETTKTGKPTKMAMFIQSPMD